MNIDGENFRSVWKKGNTDTIVIIDQRKLPHQLLFEELSSTEQVCQAISEMHLRGAPLIGIVAAFGSYYAFKEVFQMQEKFEVNEDFNNKIESLKQTRPTAINLEWALNKQLELINSSKDKSVEEILNDLFKNAFQILEEDISLCHAIGTHALKIIEEIHLKKSGQTVNILTHCNAGWLATGDYGTATSGIYQAHDKGIPIHVYVDETRPRNQGARLTAWELGQHGINHTVIADNTGGHLMQHSMVDACFVGTDRVAANGDVANKIGTYLKALAAHDNNIPFYVALPYSTFDFTINDGLKDIPIEQRGSEEVRFIQGLVNGKIERVLLTPEESKAINFGFDVTPAKYVTKLITEKGVCDASKSAIREMYPEAFKNL